MRISGVPSLLMYMLVHCFLLILSRRDVLPQWRILCLVAFHDAGQQHGVLLFVVDDDFSGRELRLVSG